jgi:hypothetical protein
VRNPAAPEVRGLASLLVTQGNEWIFTGRGAAEISVRSVLFDAAAFAGMCVSPILVDWMLVGR